MLEQVLEIVKEKAMEAINGNVAIPVDKREESVEATTHSITEGLKDQLNMSNIGNLTNLLSGGSAPASNPIVSSIKGGVIDALVKKVGLSQVVSSQVADAVLSAVVGALSKLVNDSGDKGFDLTTLVQSVSGSQGGSLLGSLGKLFG